MSAVAARLDATPAFHADGEPGSDAVVAIRDALADLDVGEGNHDAGALTVPFVDLRASYEPLKDDIDAAVAEVLKRGDFVLGAALERFEHDFAEYCGVPHAIGVDSGFSALELLLRAHGIGPGDEVITAANTFVATVAAIEGAGARPVLVDVLPDYTMDPEQVRGAITPRTAAILPVHLYGQVSHMEAVSAIAARHGLVVVEDACQAHGARYRGRRAGALGHGGAFSFYPSKNLGAFGDGGMVVAHDDALASQLRKLRNLGGAGKYRHEIKGFNRRLDTLHAAVLAVKLRHLDADNEARRLVALLYGELLKDTPLVTPTAERLSEHVFHLYVCQAEQRDALREHLERWGVSTGVHYPVPVHLQPAYESLGYARGCFPITEAAAEQIVSLPMYPGLPLNGLVHVSRAVGAFSDN